MGKTHLTLYIDTDLKDIAKASNLNLSQEFEEWIRIRLNKNIEITEDKDIDFEIAKYRQEISKLQSEKELQKEQSYKDQEEIMVIDNIIDQEIDMRKKGYNKEKSWDMIIDERIPGLQFLFKRKFNKLLNPLEAKELLIKRCKERNIKD